MCDAEELLEIQNLKERLSYLKTSLSTEEFTVPRQDSDSATEGDLRTEIKGLMEDLKSFRVEFDALNKEKSFYKVMLEVQKENFSLKSELKNLQTEQSSPTIISSSEYLESVDRLENEKSSLNNQLEFYKDKEMDRDRIFSEVETKIFELENTLKTSRLKNKTLRDKLKSLQLNGSSLASTESSKNEIIFNLETEMQFVMHIPNRKLNKTDCEQRKQIALGYMDSQYSIDIFFDDQASLSIAGPSLFDYWKSVALQPSRYTHYKFATGTINTCLGYIIVDLYDSDCFQKYYCEAQIYIFKEAVVPVFNKLHWKACKCPNSRV